MKNAKILALNFGSTSTKIALFEGDKEQFIKSFNHGQDHYPSKFKNLDEHEAFAKGLVLRLLDEYHVDIQDIDVFVARGGAQVFIESGAYVINDIMFNDTFKFGGDRHPGKLGTRICYHYSREYHKDAYIVNGPSVDEFIEEARFTGLKGLYRYSRIHALNQKEVAYRYAKSINKKYRELNLIVCHLGGGTSITAHQKGKMIDSNDIIEGEGPMTPTRVGALPVMAVIELAYSGKYEKEALILKMVKTGGFADHLGTTDLREILKNIDNEDAYARKVVNAMLYQIKKQIGAMAASLNGAVDQILITGGMSHASYVTEYLLRETKWLADATIYKGEFEMQALIAGVQRVLSGEEKALDYTGADVWNGMDV